MTTIVEYLSENRDRIQNDLKDFLRIPSISAQTGHKGDCLRAAQWLEQRFLEIGFKPKLFPLSTGHSIVYAESPQIAGAPTVLIYGHYDVQPVDPLELWTETDEKPFEPVEKDGFLWGRGTSDDKGPLYTHFAAAEFWMKQPERPKIKIKFMLEGDEESGNSATEIFVRENSELLACDFLALSDTVQFAPGFPSITCGLRGVLSYELTLYGPKQDVHSGIYGGVLANPCNVLMEILGRMVDENRRIQLPGFYDDVRRLSEEEELQIHSLPFDERSFYATLGVNGGIGEKDRIPLERLTTRPTFDINGITGGYQGEGGKTIIPSKASAKFTFRIVPDQDEDEITNSLKKWIEAQIPPGIHMDLEVGGGAPGMMVDLSRPCMKAAARAVEFGFGRAPVFIREGGSIPIVGTFSSVLTPNIMMLGYSQKGDNAHGPNEHFSLADFERGIKTNVKLLQELSAL
ncbi:MAG: dipeptidase [Thermoguttaceae bacterium]|nr:dipeptidase [Thermoguttaceae bacterium]